VIIADSRDGNVHFRGMLSQTVVAADDPGTRHSGRAFRQAVSLRKMRLPIFPLVTRRKSQRIPASNNPVIQVALRAQEGS